MTDTPTDQYTRFHRLDPDAVLPPPISPAADGAEETVPRPADPAAPADVPAPDAVVGGAGGGGGVGSAASESALLPASWVAGGWTLAAVLVLFLAVSADFLKADLWFDELLTLYNFALPGDWTHPFRSYPVANNHILFSALVRVWLYASGGALVAEVLRFPCLLMALGGVALVFRHGRRLFGGPAALLAAVALALSPVFLNFALQLRGYGLSMFLGLAALLGVLHLLEERFGEGLWMSLPALLLLPAVVPSNLLYNGSLWLFAAICLWRDGRLHRRPGRWLAVLAVLGVAGVAGLAVYWPIRDQFLRVLGATRGYEAGGLAVVRIWAWAAAAQSVMLLLACLALWRAPEVRADPGREEAASPSIRRLPLLAVCCLAPLVAVALWRAPFPRAFLACWPAMVLCGLAAYRPCFANRFRSYGLLLFFVVGNGAVWHRVNAYLAWRDLDNGRPPQHLMAQYYARSNDIALAAELLAELPTIAPGTRIFVPFEHYLAFLFYWGMGRQPPPMVECLGGGGGVGERFGLRREPDFYRRVPQVIVAYNEERARRLYRQTMGTEVTLMALGGAGRIQVFRVVRQWPRTVPEAADPPGVNI